MALNSWFARSIVALVLVLSLLAIGINHWWGVQRAAFLPEQLTADLALQDDDAITQGSQSLLLRRQILPT